MTIARREVLRAGLGALFAPAVGSVQAAKVSPKAAASAPDQAASRPPQHFPFGPVLPPRPVTAWPLVTHLAARTDLRTLLQGRITALQLMFTGCSATCPIQGALFAQAQRDLVWPTAARAAPQFVSLSIDPLSDTPAALAAWLKQFAARPGWTAVVTRPGDLDAVTRLLSEGGETPSTNAQDPHTGQVYLFDAAGQLVFRLSSLPTPKAIDEALIGVARRG